MKPVRSIKKIQIMGDWVRIRLTNRKKFLGTNDKGEINEGNNDAPRGVIYIYSQLPESAKWDALSHEILHYCHIKLGFEEKWCDTEEYVIPMGGLWGQVLQQLVT